MNPQKKENQKSTQAIFRIPRGISEAISNLQKAVDRLANLHPLSNRRFTLDGRVIGDIGEVIANAIFDIKLKEHQTPGFDAKVMTGANKDKRVEIKCRRKCDVIDFVTTPDLLVVLWICDNDACYELVYAGPGDVIRSIKPKSAKRSRVKLSELRDRFSWNAFENDPTIPLRKKITPVSAKLIQSIVRNS